MEKSLEVRRKIKSGREDAGKGYTLRFSNFCNKTDLFPGCIVYKLDDGDSWNFKTLTQYFWQTFDQALEQDDLEIIQE